MKKIIITILLVALCLGIVGGGIAGIVKLTDSDKIDLKTVSSSNFSVGGLDGVGKYMNTNGSIYTKEAFECQGLQVTPDFDNEVEYQIYFYDQNNTFVHTTGKLSGAFVKESVPFFAKYARIVVTPKNDEVVSTLEVLKYAGQLTIKVNREQGFKNYTENLIEKIETGYYYNATGVKTAIDDSYSGSVTAVSPLVNISSYKEGLMFRSNGGSEYAGGYEVFFYNADKSFISKSIVRSVSSVSFTSSNNVVYYNLCKDDMPEGTVYIAFGLLVSGVNEFVCR